MVCHHPYLAYKITDKKGNVKIKVIGSCYDDFSFNEKLGNAPAFEARLKPIGGSLELIKFGCGQCNGCKLERSRIWAVRCIHEASLHAFNCFLTLTYDDAHLPNDESLHKEDLQKFWKRLRKSLGGLHVRYFACGEYGSQLNRPHYHAIVFGYWPDDAKLFNIRRGTELYISDSISRLWPFGFHTVGHVSFESAAYVARYVLKKVTGKQADFYYDGLQPEFVVMSRKPGIAYGWIKKFHGDVYPHDFIVIRDKFKCKPPKYYDMIYDRDLNGDLQYIKNKRADCHVNRSWSDIERNKKFTDQIIKSKLKRNYEESI